MFVPLVVVVPKHPVPVLKVQSEPYPGLDYASVGLKKLRHYHMMAPVVKADDAGVVYKHNQRAYFLSFFYSFSSFEKFNRNPYLLHV